MSEAIVPNSSIITQMISQSDEPYIRTIYTRLFRLVTNSTSFSYDKVFRDDTINTADFGIYEIRKLYAQAAVTYTAPQATTPADYSVTFNPSSSSIQSGVPTTVGTTVNLTLCDYTSMNMFNSNLLLSYSLGLSITKLSSGYNIRGYCTRLSCSKNQNNVSNPYDFKPYVVIAFI